jgi:hypothetical protein
MTVKATRRLIPALAVVLFLGVSGVPAGAARTALHVPARHPAVPIPIRMEPVLLGAERASMLPRLGDVTLHRIAGRLASLTAELRAIGDAPERVDDLTARVVDRTRCRVVNRTFLVPRGFADQRAIDDRIELEATFHHAQVTGAAEWAIQPTSTSAPSFSRIIAVVYLSACPTPRART